VQELLQEILPWIVAFVLLDAVVQLRVGQVLLVRAWPAPVRLREPGVGIAGLWPHAELVPLHELPFLPARDGAWFRDPDARGTTPVIVPAELAFASRRELDGAACEGRKVVAGGRTLVKALSASGASRIAAALRELARADERSSEVLAAQVAAAMDPDPLRALRARTRPLRSGLAAIGAAWSVLLVLVLPFAAWSRAVPLAPLLALVALGVALAVVAAALMVLVLRRAGVPIAAALGRAVPLLLFPPLAARALPLASREVQPFVDPLAALAVLAPREIAGEACRRELVRIHHSRASTAALGLGELWDARERAVRTLATRESLEEEALRPPAARDGGAVCVCPLCEASYRLPVESCRDCGIPPVPVPLAEGAQQRACGTGGRVGT
jgi:hypothetical protein